MTTLKEISAVAGIEVVRDGSFSNLGLLSHAGGAILAGFYEARFVSLLRSNPDISCILTTKQLADQVPESIAVAIADDVKVAFYGLHEYLHRNTEFYWKEFETEVAPDAQIDKTASVAARNVRIGSGTVVGPHAVILERCLIGANVAIHPGAVIGGEGFEPKWVGGKHVNISHAGGVRIGDGVQLLAQAHVARAVFGGFTEIGEGCIIDVNVHIAHNAKVGANCEIAANAVVAGSTTLGDEVWIGPNASVSSEVTVGKRGFVTLGSVVIHPVAENAHVSGYFAFDHREFKQAWKRFRGNE
jgi:UDP-3-O-[3-hydroxymyristoyl] glucosamine N-acyltransferase